MTDLRFKPDYQPWNEEEFWADIHVQCMPWVAAHLYKSLCNAAFFCSTRPLLPAIDSELWLHARAENLEQWLLYKPMIIKRFKVVLVGGKRMLKHKRITADWEHLRDARKKHSTDGINGNKKRWGKGSPAIPPQSPGDRQPIASKGSEVSEVSQVSKEELAMSISFLGFVKVWQEHHGESATCPEPINTEKFKTKTKWKELISNHTHTLLLAAFEVWAKEQAAEGNTTRYPISEFMRVSSDYMRMIKPLKTDGVKEARQKAVEVQSGDEAASRAARLLAVESKPKDEEESYI